MKKKTFWRKNSKVTTLSVAHTQKYTSLYTITENPVFSATKYYLHNQLYLYV